MSHFYFPEYLGFGNSKPRKEKVRKHMCREGEGKSWWARDLEGTVSNDVKLTGTPNTTSVSPAALRDENGACRKPR